MKCIIVDDEPLARDEMAALIGDIAELEILGTFSNAPAAIAFLKSNDIDLVFLDIEMPMVTGLEFAAQLPRNVLVIFTTAYTKYALTSYELDAIDYLLKPVEKSRLEKAIVKARLYRKMLLDEVGRNTVEGSTANFLIVKSDRRFHRVNFSDIRFIEGLKDYVVIHTISQKLITAMNLKNIHGKLPLEMFIRVSKSYVVNMSFIESFDHHTIYLEGTEIPLGEVYKKEFLSVYLGGAFSMDI